ncbi:hypothetical protein GVAV_002035 [Gurleya vavrai]
MNSKAKILSIIAATCMIGFCIFLYVLIYKNKKSKEDIIDKNTDKPTVDDFKIGKTQSKQNKNSNDKLGPVNTKNKMSNVILINRKTHEEAKKNDQKHQTHNRLHTIIPEPITKPNFDQFENKNAAFSLCADCKNRQSHIHSTLCKPCFKIQEKTRENERKKGDKKQVLGK